MAPPALSSRGPLRIGNVMEFEWKPSPYILATEMATFGGKIRTFKEPLTKAIKEVAIPSIKQNFADEGRPDSWQGLAEYTVTRRLDEGFGEGPILQRTGKLMKAATAFARWKVTSDDATVTGDFPASVWYAGLHQNGHFESGTTKAIRMGIPSAIANSYEGGGGKFPKAKGQVVIPERPFMMLQEEDIDKIEDIFKEWISDKLRSVGYI